MTNTENVCTVSNLLYESAVALQGLHPELVRRINEFGRMVFKTIEDATPEGTCDRSFLFDADGRKPVCRKIQTALALIRMPKEFENSIRAELERVVARIDGNPEGFREVESSIARGKTLMNTGQAAAARPIFLGLHERFPQDSMMLYLLGECECSLHDYDSAITHLTASYELFPGFPSKSTIDTGIGQ